MSQPFSPAEKATITCWRGNWVGLRAGLAAVEKWKLCFVMYQFVVTPFILYWLHYRKLNRVNCLRNEVSDVIHRSVFIKYFSIPLQSAE